MNTCAPRVTSAPPLTGRRTNRRQIHAEDPELPGSRFLGGTAEAIVAVGDSNVLESDSKEGRNKLCLRQSARDSTGPQFDVARDGVRQLYTIDDIRELKPTAWPQNAGDLGERAVLFRHQVEHSVRNHHID